MGLSVNGVPSGGPGYYSKWHTVTGSAYSISPLEYREKTARFFMGTCTVALLNSDAQEGNVLRLENAGCEASLQAAPASIEGHILASRFHEQCQDETELLDG